MEDDEYKKIREQGFKDYNDYLKVEQFKKASQEYEQKLALGNL